MNGKEALLSPVTDAATHVPGKIIPHKFPCQDCGKITDQSLKNSDNSSSLAVLPRQDTQVVREGANLHPPPPSPPQLPHGWPQNAPDNICHILLKTWWRCPPPPTHTPNKHILVYPQIILLPTANLPWRSSLPPSCIAQHWLLLPLLLKDQLCLFILED